MSDTTEPRGPDRSDRADASEGPATHDDWLAEQVRLLDLEDGFAA